MITQEQRNKKIESLSETFKDLYSNPDAGEFYSTIFSKNLLEQRQYTQYINVIGDTILGFYAFINMAELLQKEVGVSADDAQRIVADLTEFLAPVIAHEKEEMSELQKLQETFSPVLLDKKATDAAEPTQQGTAPNETTSQSTSKEEHIPVQAMRTMEGDMSRIHGYGAYRAEFPEEPQEAEHAEEVIRGASQDDILQEKPKLAAMPTYEEKE